MAQKSMFWYTNEFTGAVGDGSAPYTQTEMRRWQESTLGEGVLSGVDNELVVTAGASQVTVDTGRAQVAGFHYWNDLSTVVAITTPAVGDTGGRAVLQANWTGIGGPSLEARVRIRVVLNTDGNPAIPPLDQTVGTTYEIPLATFVIDTGGVLYTDASKSTTGVTDARQFAISPLAGMVKLREVIITAPTLLIQFEGIQQNLSHLRIQGSILGSTGRVNNSLRMAFNNDTASGNYENHLVTFVGGASSSIQDSGADTIHAGTLSSDRLLTDQRDSVVIDMPNYADASYVKTAQCRVGALTNGVNFTSGYHNGFWDNNTEGIHTILLFQGFALATFSPGTKLSLYGIR